MKRPATILLAVIAAFIGPQRQGVAASDTKWPCEQPKGPPLSLAQGWSGPAVDLSATDWKQDQAVSDLVRRVAARREPIEQAQQDIRRFALEAGPHKRDQMIALLVGVFNTLDEERGSVLAGLDRFGDRQSALASEIRDTLESLRALQAAPGKDPAAVEKLTQQVNWEVQVFQDRRRVVRYVCDVPSKIEHRLIALARTIQSELE